MKPKKCATCGETFEPRRPMQKDCSPKCERERKAQGKTKKVNRNTAQANRSGKKKNVSQKLRKSAKGRNCTLRLAECNHDIDTTVLAHLPCGQKGIGIKSPDYMAVFACSDCHDVIDARVKGEFDESDLLRALAETWAIWIDEGLIKVE